MGSFPTMIFPDFANELRLAKRVVRKRSKTMGLVEKKWFCNLSFLKLKVLKLRKGYTRPV